MDEQAQQTKIVRGIGWFYCLPHSERAELHGKLLLQNLWWKKGDLDTKILEQLYTTEVEIMYDSETFQLLEVKRDTSKDGMARR